MAALCACAEGGAGELTIGRTIPPSNVTGHVNHLAFDNATRRLAVTEFENDSVDSKNVDDAPFSIVSPGMQKLQGLAFGRPFLSSLKAKPHGTTV